LEIGKRSGLNQRSGAEEHWRIAGCRIEIKEIRGWIGMKIGDRAFPAGNGGGGDGRSSGTGHIGRRRDSGFIRAHPRHLRLKAEP